MAEEKDIKNKNIKAILDKRKENVDVKDLDRELIKNNTRLKEIGKNFRESVAILTRSFTETIKSISTISNPSNYRSLLKDTFAGITDLSSGFSEAIKKLIPSNMRENFDRLSKVINTVARDFSGLIPEFTSLTDEFIEIRKEIIGAIATSGHLSGILSNSREVYNTYTEALVDVAKQTGKTFQEITDGVSGYLRTSSLIASGNLQQADSVTIVKAAFKAYSDTVILARQVGMSLQDVVYLQKQAFEDYGITVDKFNKLMLGTSASFRNTGINIATAMSELTSLTNDFKYLNIQLETTSKNLASFIKLSNTKGIFQSPKQAAETYLLTLKSVSEAQNDLARSAFFGMMAGNVGYSRYNIGGLADALKFMSEDANEAQKIIFDTIKNIYSERGDFITLEEAKTSPDLATKFYSQVAVFQSILNRQLSPMQVGRLVEAIINENIEEFGRILEDTSREVSNITKSTDLISEANMNYSKNLYTLGETANQYMSQLYMTFGNTVTNITKEINEKLAKSIGSATSSLIDFSNNLTNINKILEGTQTYKKNKQEKTPQEFQIQKIEEKRQEDKKIKDLTKDLYESTKKSPIDFLGFFSKKITDLLIPEKKPDIENFPKNIINNNLDELKEIKIKDENINKLINNNNKKIDKLEGLSPSKMENITNNSIINNNENIIENKNIKYENNINNEQYVNKNEYNVDNRTIRTENNIEYITDERKYSRELFNELKKKDIEDNILKNKILSGVFQKESLILSTTNINKNIELNKEYYDSFFDKLNKFNIEDKKNKPKYENFINNNDLEYIKDKINNVNIIPKVDFNNYIYTDKYKNESVKNNTEQKSMIENKEMYLNINLVIDGNKLASVLIKNEQINNFIKNNYNKINEETYINNGNYNPRRKA